MKKLTMLVAITTMVGLITGCSTPTLTTHGKLVREIGKDSNKACRYLGTVEGEWGSGFGTQEDIKGAYIVIKNKTAALGGDSVVVSHKRTDPLGAYVLADAYDCGFNKKAAQKDKN